MTGGAHGEDFWKKRKGEGAVGPAGPKGGARLGRKAGPRRVGERGGWAAWAKGKGAAGPKGGEGGREKEKAFLFPISSFSYMPNSPLHSTTNKRVHNPQ
jgi:hypothetical protein